MDFDEFLEKKKSEFRKLKDSDFTSISLNVPEEMKREINETRDDLSKRHQMDIMEVDSAAFEYGIEAMEKLIQYKGINYAKKLIEELSDTTKKGDFKKMQKLINQMNKDLGPDDDYMDDYMYDYIYTGENGKNLSFEQFAKLNEEKLLKKFNSLKKEDFEVIKARNPENPEDIIDLRLHKDQIKEMKKDAENFGIPIEEFAFIVIMESLENLENMPVEEKQIIREFLNRQMYKIKNDIS